MKRQLERSLQDIDAINELPQQLKDVEASLAQATLNARRAGTGPITTDLAFSVGSGRRSRSIRSRRQSSCTGRIESLSAGLPSTCPRT